MTRVLPASWVGRVIATLMAVTLAVIGFFFVAFALIAAAIVAAVVAARMWWVFRKLRAQQNAQVIEGAYSVEVEQTQAIESDTASRGALPLDRK